MLRRHTSFYFLVYKRPYSKPHDLRHHDLAPRLRYGKHLISRRDDNRNIHTPHYFLHILSLHRCTKKLFFANRESGA